MKPFRKDNPGSIPNALLVEAAGLDHLRQTVASLQLSLRIPRVISVSPETLTLEFIPSGNPTPELWRILGEQLARLHQQAQPHYGLDHVNCIGLSPQPNTLSENWGHFFCEYRLRFQVERIADQALRSRFLDCLDRARPRLEAFLNEHCDHASLLHGDLWRGNVLFSQDSPWLIDPAIYCGDADADLAMTELFGGFDQQFYQAYRRLLPASRHYPVKRAIYNLYHQLNHYNLFGTSYLPACEAGFRLLARL